jgi:hypothetical protein
MAQHASPKVRGHKEEVRAQAKSCSALAVMIPGVPDLLKKLSAGWFPELLDPSQRASGLVRGISSE